VHYSLLVYNDHYHNPSKEGALLVPSSILAAALSGSLYQLGDNQSNERQSNERTTPPADLIPPRLSRMELQKAVAEKGLNILDLSWPSNVGGLCNAFPPARPPYHQWESKVYDHSKDGAGHVHKSHIRGRYQTTWTVELSQAVAPLQEAHSKVYHLARAYFNLNDLFRISRALWHKGLTLPDSEYDDQRIVADEDSDDRDMGPHETRMLKEVYRWHSKTERAGTKQADLPILTITPTTNYLARSGFPATIDTESLTLRTASAEVQLPSIHFGFEPSEEAARIWKEIIRPLYLQHSELDLLFRSRTDLEG
jgi:hypothetical protein